MHVDDEVCFGAVARAMLVRFNIIYVPTGPKSHVPIIENRIRIIKERVQCILAAVPFKVPLDWVTKAVYYVVSRLNMVITKSRSDDKTPREAFDERILRLCQTAMITVEDNLARFNKDQIEKARMGRRI
jgi:hypothetical protein